MEWLRETGFWKKVVAGLLASGIFSVVDWLFGFFVWKSILSGIAYVGALLGTSVEAPLWLMLILGLSALAWIGFPVYRYAQEEPEEKPLHEREFTEGEIRGIPWTWSWIDGDPVDPDPLCPECKMRVDLKDSQSSFTVKELEVSQLPLHQTAKVGGSTYPDLRTVRTVAICPDHGEVEEWKQKSERELLDVVKREIKKRVRTGEWQQDG